jgi:hypothetical protein
MDGVADMNNPIKRVVDGLGWSLVTGLALAFSIQAGALDLDKETARHNQSSKDISRTLGRDRGSIKPKKVQELPSLDASDLQDDYKVELIPVRRDKSS